MISHVVMVGMPTTERPHQRAYEAWKMGKPSDYAFAIDKDTIAKTTRPTSSPSALLIGLDSRPSRDDIKSMVKKLGGQDASLLTAHRVWNNPGRTFEVQVFSNQHRIAMEPEQQALWDLAKADDFTKRTPVRHPHMVADFYRKLGNEVSVKAVKRTLDNRVAAYRATITLDPEATGHIHSIGAYRHYSGLLVPCTSS